MSISNIKLLLYSLANISNIHYSINLKHNFKNMKELKNTYSKLKKNMLLFLILILTFEISGSILLIEYKQQVIGNILLLSGISLYFISIYLNFFYFKKK